MRQLVHVQALVPQAPVKRFNENIFHGFARSNEVEPHAPPIGPIFQCPRLEFRSMIHRDRAWPRPSAQKSIEDVAHHLHPTSKITPQVTDCGDSRYRRPSGSEIVVHRPWLSWTKSMLQRSVGPAGVGAGPRCNAIYLRRRTRMRSCKPSSR